MSTALLGALITAGAALVVAIVGSVTSVLVSLRTSRAAIEQIRYGRAHDRRDEVLATIYVYLYDLHDGLKVQEFQGYQRRHALWLSTARVKSIDPGEITDLGASDLF